MGQNCMGQGVNFLDIWGFYDDTESKLCLMCFFAKKVQMETQKMIKTKVKHNFP